MSTMQMDDDDADESGLAPHAMHMPLDASQLEGYGEGDYEDDSEPSPGGYGGYGGGSEGLNYKDAAYGVAAGPAYGYGAAVDDRYAAGSPSSADGSYSGGLGGGGLGAPPEYAEGEYDFAAMTSGAGGGGYRPPRPALDDFDGGSGSGGADDVEIDDGGSSGVYDHEYDHGIKGVEYGDEMAGGRPGDRPGDRAGGEYDEGLDGSGDFGGGYGGEYGGELRGYGDELGGDDADQMGGEAIGEELDDDGGIGEEAEEALGGRRRRGRY